MASTRRVKNVDFDDDEDDYFYSDEEGGAHDTQDAAYTAEDADNFRTLTPVVKAELEEAGFQASNREIQDALWDNYWDVSKSVAYLKNSRTPRKPQQTPKKEKQKSKFDQAAEASAQKADHSPSLHLPIRKWFENVPWDNVPAEMIGSLVPAEPFRQPPRLLGGSSKLAKLAEERRRKAAAGQSTEAKPDTTVSALDRLSKPKDPKENDRPAPVAEPRRYPVRKKRELTPPPAPPEPEPLPEEEKVQLPDLRASPSAFARTLSISPIASAMRPMTLQDLLGGLDVTKAFNEPSPDDKVMHAQQHSKESTMPKAKADVNGLAQKTQAVKLDTAASTSALPKVKSKNLDVPKLCAEQRSQRKPSAAFVVIGHVDHGKSTLMGRLLLDTGAVQQRDIDKYRKQATELGKSSFALAWVMDTSSDERERGVTVEVAQHHFSTDRVDFTILDAPGHRDFVPAMIGGASMADLAVLVVDVNQLESGMKGQTREHMQLAKAAGLQRVVVAINKLDSTTPPWDQQLFESVKAQVLKFLREAGFSEEAVTIVPCSGLNGENVAKPPSKNTAARWTTGNDVETLLQALEAFLPPEATKEVIAKPFRMQVADVFRGGVMNPLSVAGRIGAGNVQIGDVLTVEPSGENASLKAIDIGGDARDFAVAGQIATLHLDGDLETLTRNLRSGDLLCNASKPAKTVQTFVANVDALESLLPQGADVHIGRLHVPGKISQLVETLDKKGGVLKKKPRIVKERQRARVKVVLEQTAGVAETIDT